MRQLDRLTGWLREKHRLHASAWAVPPIICGDFNNPASRDDATASLLSHLCDYCDYAMRLPTACAKCTGEYLEHIGFGTERVEAEVTALFPHARVARVDRDTIRRRGAITALAPSPRSTLILWAGTDDGLIQMTTNGGASWRDVTPAGIAQWTRIFNIEAGHFDAQTAYAAANTLRIEGGGDSDSMAFQVLVANPRDSINWWVPSKACVGKWFEGAGFTRVSIDGTVTLRPDRPFADEYGRSSACAQVLHLVNAWV